MQHLHKMVLLQKFKNPLNYSQPNNPLAQGLLHTDVDITIIMKVLADMLEDNYNKTVLILGIELTRLVQEYTLQPLHTIKRCIDYKHEW